MPLVSRTRATLRSAEFGFFGVVVYTRVQTPRRWGEPLSAGVLVFSALVSRPLRTSWAIVGTRVPSRDISGRLPIGSPGKRPGARYRCRSQRTRVSAEPEWHQV